MSIKNTYLYQLKSRNQPAFVVAIICILMITLTSAMRSEITPFLNWSMYSTPTPYTDSFSSYIIEYNNDQVFNAPHTWRDHKRMMLYYTVDYYTVIKDNGGREPDAIKMGKLWSKLGFDTSFLAGIYNRQEAIDKYPAWLKQYMQSNMGIHIDSVKVYRKWMKFKNDGKVYPSSDELLLKA